MKRTIYVLTSTLAALALFLSACGGEVPATPDAAAISTAAAQTVEARFTLQAVLQATETPAPPAETPIPAVTATLGSPPTLTTAPGLPTPTNNGKACYAMTFISDITIPDGMIITPGTKFTKTWRVRNDGNCTWDQSYYVVLDQGDPMTTVTKFPLTKTVFPGETYDISIDMTAPETDGFYSGYWHIATPYGGYLRLSGYNQALFVKIQVTPKTDRYFGAVSVIYDWNRKPAKGCGSDGAVYNFSATITVNGPGEIEYEWARIPWDGDPLQGGTLKFTEAGSKTVYFTWSLHNGQIENIDRWVAIRVLSPNPRTFDRVKFYHTCQP